MVHRDIKLANLLISSDGCIKAGDFGFATQLDYAGQLRHAKCGTPDYVAPEVLADGVGHSHEVDVWAVGCMLYAMLYGKPPFQTSSIETTFERVRKIDYAFPDSPDVSQEAKDLIRSILVEDPKQRCGPAPLPLALHVSQRRVVY